MRQSLSNGLKKKYPAGSVISVGCYQWGDTGKGKLLDLLMSIIADIGVRPMGADNCGHTLVTQLMKIVTHMIPSSVAHDHEGKISVIGRNVAFNPLTARRELTKLVEAGISYDNLKISWRAKLNMPYHILFDRLNEARANPEKKIGTTGRGVGPVFQDHAARVGLYVVDMLDEDVLYQKIQHVLPDRIAFLKTLDPRIICDILDDDDLESGRFFDSIKMLNVDAIVARYLEHGEFFRDMICDTEEFIRSQVGRVTIALEGAQGNLLDIDHGSYPFVTSSHCTNAGLANGAGLREQDVTHNINVVKAYITRVGEGCMPTEIGGYNAVETFRKLHEKNYQGVNFEGLINHSNPIVQGAAIGRIGGEFGATTGRLRRIGWLDIAALRHSVNLNNSPTIAITKLDVLTGLDKIPVCVGYRYIGPTNPAMSLKNGQILSVMRPENIILVNCEPIYEVLDGWIEDITGAESWEDLPKNSQDYLKFIEKSAGVKIEIVSVGPDREQTFLL